MSHPYRSLPPKSFWRSGTAPATPGHIPGIYSPKIEITRDTAIATAGSCFAQHIGRALRSADCNLLDLEPPIRRMPTPIANRFGYGIYSARYGNIYTPRQLLELLQELQSDDINPDLIWEKNGRYYDALRPGVEPEGLETAQDVQTHRQFHLGRVRQMLAQTDVFIFTLGLTEAWQDNDHHRILPVCPGIIAGTFDETRHTLHTFRHAEIVADLTTIHDLLQKFRPGMKILLTVSPVPLTATATGNHVLTTSANAKATLRAAAGDFAQDHDDVDYFPAYEIITSAVCDGPWFEPNGRDVAADGIDRVMQCFFDGHGLPRMGTPAQEPDDPDDPNCEEILLQAFAP